MHWPLHYWRGSRLENNIYVMHNFNVLHNDLQFKGSIPTEITCVTAGTTAMLIVGIKCTKKTEVKDNPLTCKCGAYNQNSTPMQNVYIIFVLYNISKDY
ncbi:hypothetical protein Lal_00003082 [Lupinus albus]|nr:hypothetical protein Lal_00003082 [Lupinus albus]